MRGTMLEWNVGKIKNLTGLEIWSFIIARVLIGFGLGAMTVRFFPAIGNRLAVPVLAIGLVLFLVAGKRLLRKTSG